MTIHRLEIRDASKLPREFQHWGSVDVLRDLKELKFERGLNILFGPNGVGKSTALGLMATLAHCKQGGLPLITYDSLFQTFGANGEGAGAVMTVDSKPVYYADPSQQVGMFPGGGAFDDDFFAEGIASVMSRMSAGETCLSSLSRVVAAATKGTPRKISIHNPIGGHTSEEYTRSSPHYATWQSTQNVVPDQADSAPTMILDEFDRSIDIPGAQRLWGLMACYWQMKCQIIVAGHSPTVIQLHRAGIANVIELVPGYMKACEAAQAQLTKCVDLDDDAQFAKLPEVFKWREDGASKAADAGTRTRK